MMIVILLNGNRCLTSSGSATFIEDLTDCTEGQKSQLFVKYLRLALPPVSIMLAKTFFQVRVFVVTARFLNHVPYVNLA